MVLEWPCTSLLRYRKLFVALRRACRLLYPAEPTLKEAGGIPVGHGWQGSALRQGLGSISSHGFNARGPSHPTFHPLLLFSQPFFSLGSRGGPIDNLIKKKINHPQSCPKPPACSELRLLFISEHQGMDEELLIADCAPAVRAGLCR